MAEQVAQFRFLNYRISKSVIQIDSTDEISQQLDVEFTQASGVNEEALMYKHTLEVVISNENKSIHIEIVADGMFEFDKELTDVQKSNFFNINAPSILFPYVRAYITALTSLAGIQPIVLPTLNLSVRSSKESEWVHSMCAE